MRRSGFNEMVIELFDYFQRKEPSDRMLDKWFARVRNNSSEAITWALDKIMADFDSIPRNLPKTINALCITFKSQNTMTEEKIFTNCKTCCGRGLIWKQQIIHNNPYEFVYRCTECDNWRHHGLGANLLQDHDSRQYRF